MGAIHGSRNAESEIILNANKSPFELLSQPEM